MRDLVQLLSPVECEEILISDGISGAILETRTIQPVSEHVNGFLGEHHLYEFIYHTKDDGRTRSKVYFMKLVDGEFGVTGEMVRSISAYEKETFFYDVLLPELTDGSYAPKCFYNKNGVMILENLSVDGYRMKGTKTLDLLHLKLALKTLAKFHADTFIYEKTNGLKQEQLLESKLFSSKTNLANKWLKCSFDGILNLTPLVKFKNLTKLKNLFNNVPGIFDDFRQKYTNFILHSDLWANNFLFKYENGDPTFCKLIDYQTIAHAPPALDVMHLILSNTRKSFRRIHQSDLIKFYYTNLIGNLKSSDSKEFQCEESFLKVCEEVKCLIKLVIIADRSITLMPEEVIGEAMTSDETFKHFLFENRGDSITDTFLNHDDFKEILTEDLLELDEWLN